MHSSITSRRLRTLVLVWPAVAVSAASGVSVAAAADPPPPAAVSDAPVPEQNVLSSIKQSFNQNFDRDVIRGHFDVGAAAGVHRYYCLIDAKSGKREPNGVPGDPVRRPDGMTGIKASSVSVYSCASAEQQGLLVTADYPLDERLRSAPAAPAAAMTHAAPAPTAVAMPTASAASPAVALPVTPALPPSVPGMPTVDVAGVRLGMSLDAARALLRSKALANYFESEAAIGSGAAASGAAAPGVAPRFVNVIAAWTPADRATAGESYQLMLTPTPGHERVLAVVHTMMYPTGNALPESALKAALFAKYGGYATPASVPRAPTWLVQRDGSVQVGDGCNRRGLMAGWNEPSGVNARPNLALDTTQEELEFQREHCGVAIVTEDHPAAVADTARGGVVIKYTVTAYGPAITADASLELRDATAKTLKFDPVRAGAAVPNL